MQKFFNWLDDIGGIETENVFARWLERAAFFFLILMILSAPHSIAATQTAWLTGMTAWIIRLFIKPRPKLVRTPLDIPLWAFFTWSAITSIFSYDPPTSLDRLRNVLLFLIFYFVINNLKNIRAVKFIAFALIFSSMVSVLWTPIDRLIGRGVEIQGVAANSPLTKAIYLENNSETIVMKDGDTLVEVNKKKLRSPEQLINELEKNETVQVLFYRPDYYLPLQIKRANLLDGANALEKLGITDWKRSHNWRSAGFYGHYTTFSEVLQLIGSLTFGLLIAAFLRKKDERAKPEENGEIESESREFEENSSTPSFRFTSIFRSFSPVAVLLFCVAMMSLALLLTVTRASQLGFLVSAFSIVFLIGNRKFLLILAAVVLPIAIGGLFFLQQSRNVGFFDTKDDSTIYRETVWREGFHLWTESPRHFFLGVGMDSIKKYAKEWHLFDDGKLPMGHFHSMPLQLLVERGLPALLLWLWILFVYGRTLWRGIKIQDSQFGDENPQFAIRNSQSFGWQTKGILLGCFGGLIGFFTGGLVHYNLGDAEVAMVFFMLMGISLALIKLLKDQNTSAANNY